MSTDEHEKIDKNNCRACAGDCEIINNLKEQKNILPCIAWVTYCVALIIVICFAIRTFWPKAANLPESINITVVDAQGHGKELSPEGKVYLKEQLQTALMKVSDNAEKAYNEKFATLLMVLTIFGIAWPVIVGFLNFKFNENALDKITLTEEKAARALLESRRASRTARAIFDKADSANSTAESVNEKTKDLKQKVDKASSDVFYIAGETRAERAEKVEERDKKEALRLYLMSIRNYAVSSICDAKNKDLCVNICKKIANILKKIDEKFSENITSTEKNLS